jgi:hypothetical protein
MFGRVIGVLGLLAVAACHFEPVGSKPEVDPGPAPADPRPDARVDQATPLPVDAGVDLVVDVAGPELAADVPADDAADVASDQTSDVTPDLPADVADLAPDQTDVAPDVSLEALPGLLGDPCTQPAACLSGVCSDGVCCATGCSGVCLSCNLPGSVGLCMVAPVGQDPRLECAAQPPETCGRAGACDGAGACRRHPDGTTCGSGRTCSGGSCEGVATDGPALWWRLDEAAGTMAADASGNGRNGTYAGSPGLPAPSAQVAPVTFANAGARAFAAGARSMVRLAPVPVALKPASNLTVSLWFRASTALITGSDIINLGGDYFLRLKPDGIEWVKRATATPSGFYAVCRTGVTTAHLDGRWHHLAGVTDAAGMRLYLDGVLGGSNARAEPIIYTYDQLLVGREGNGGANHDFEGTVDDVRIYTRALGPADVAALAGGAQ